MIRNILLFAFILSAHVLSAQSVDTALNLPSISIQTNRIQETYLESAKTISIMNQEDLKSLPVQTVQEALQYIAGIKVNSRGFPHVQSDLSIRGGSFDQALILIDGIKLNDAQTGHHLMNIPVSIEQIKRIEIIKGPSARIYGPNAYSGVINIITKDFQNEQLAVEAYGGNLQSGGASLSFQLQTGHLSHMFTVRKDFSGGYRYNTDYDINKYYYKAGLAVNRHHFNFLAAYTDREFGANGFYADASFKEQKEAIQTSIAAVQHSFSGTNFAVRNNFYWRRNQDIYIFNRKNPDAYRNFHLGNNVGIESHLSWNNRLGQSGLGIDLRREMLRSSNLGNRNRNTFALAVEHKFNFFSNQLFVTPGLFLNYYSDHGFNMLPGIDANWRLMESLSIFAAVGQTFRVPTYTDLYYEDPVNIGNPELEAERAFTSEAGVKFSNQDVVFQTSIFRRNNQSIIDWRRENDIWSATNIDSVIYTGIEGQLRWVKPVQGKMINIQFADLQYTFLKGMYFENENFQSRYTFDHLEHRFIGSVHLALFNVVSIVPAIRYGIPFDKTRSPYAVIDVKAKFQADHWGLFLEVLNLTNTSYFGASGVPMPDRWIRTGFSVRFLNAE